MPKVSKNLNRSLNTSRPAPDTATPCRDDLAAPDSDATALLVAGSPAGIAADLLRTLATQAAFVLAVDAGADQLVAAGIAPDLLIGDLDSVSRETLARLTATGVPVQDYDPHKNVTDLELGLEALRSRGYRRVIATNVSGGRTDHMLGSLGALAQAAYRNDLQVVLYDNHEACYFIGSRVTPSTLVLDFEAGTAQSNGLAPLPPPPWALACPPHHVSLVAWGGLVTVSLEGTEWPLDHYVLSPYSTRGISNIPRSAVLRLEVHEGRGTALLLASY
ncbi:MAG: thiamine diphosphokinase [Coriobacteriales bacterium]|jgi:thiamine pyrophosphokinase|nr:thiamine diphosphokinase [Coriobacteriales bacterium]